MTQLALTARWIGMGLLLCAACSPPTDSPLLNVDQVTPERVTLNSVLTISGSGFPAGRVGEVTMSGSLYSPSEADETVRIVATGRAASSEAVEVIFDESLMKKFARRGTFRGKITLAFATAGQQQVATVSGEVNDVIVDVLPSINTDETARLRKAREFLNRLGVVIDEEAGLGGELKIAEAPAELNVLPGDSFVELNGVRLDGLADFVPSEAASVAEIHVLRDGWTTPFLVRVPLNPVLQMEHDHLTAAVGVLLLVIVILAPFPLPVRRALAQRSPMPAWATLALWILTISAMVVFLMRGGALPIIVPWLLAVGVGVLDNVLRSSSSGTFTLLRIPIGAVTFSVALLIGSGYFQGIELAQGSMPWEWFLFRHPLGLFLFLAFLGGMAVDRKQSTITSAVQTTFLAVLGSALFLGGVNDMSIQSAALFLLKVFALSTLAWNCTLPQRDALRLSMLGTLAASLWMLVSPGTLASFSLWSFGAVLLLCARWFLSRKRLDSLRHSMIVVPTETAA